MAHPFLTIRTTPELKAALEARAEKEGRSTSSLAVRVLETAAKRWSGDAATVATAKKA
jgi:predicted HicB family RNase H-like nuclease